MDTSAAIQQGAEQARSLAKSELERRTRAFGGELRDTANRLRRAGSDGDGGASDFVAGIVAERVEMLAGFFEDADLETLMRRLEAQARRAPVSSAAVAFAAGFGAARFLKASSRSSTGGGGARARGKRAR